MLRKTHDTHRMIGGGGEIVDSIQESAVEVEYDITFQGCMMFDV